jgi:tellurite resistance protein
MLYIQIIIMTKGLFEQLGPAATAAAYVAAYAMAANGAVDDSEMKVLEAWLTTPDGMAVTSLSKIGGGASALALVVKGLADSFLLYGEAIEFIEDDIIEVIAKGAESAPSLLKLAQYIFGADGIISPEEKLAFDKISIALTGDANAAKELAL